MKRALIYTPSILLTTLAITFAIFFGFNVTDYNKKIDNINNTNQQKIQNIIQSHTADIKFCGIDNNYKCNTQTFITGDDIVDIYTQPYQNENCIFFLFSTSGYDKLQQLANEIGLNGYMAIYLGDELLSTPQLSSLNMPNPCFITVDCTDKQAQDMVDKFTEGSLSTKLNHQQTSTQQLKKSVSFPTVFIVLCLLSLSAAIFILVCVCIVRHKRLSQPTSGC